MHARTGEERITSRSPIEEHLEIDYYITSIKIQTILQRSTSLSEY